VTDTPATTAPRPSTTRAVVVTSATSVGLMVMGLITGVISARFLGPEGRGRLAVAQTVGTLVGTTLALALGESLIFFVRTKARAAPVVLKSAVAVALIPVVLAAALAVVLTPVLLGGDPAAIPATRWYCLIGVPLVVLGYPITFRLASGDAARWNRLRFIMPACWLLTLLGFVIAGSRSVAAIVATFVGLQLVIAPFLWRRPFRRRGSWRAAPVDPSLFGPMLRYGAPLLLATAPLTLNARVDQLVIANRAPAAELGRYAVSISYAAVGVVVLSSVGMILFPHLAALAVESRVDALARSVRGTAIIALAVGALSAAAAPALIPIVFGDQYAVPVLVPTALAAWTAFLGLNIALEAGLRALDASMWILVAEVVGIIVTIGLAIVLLPPLGIGGAALATTAGAVVVLASLTTFLRHRFGVRPTDLLVPRRADLDGLLARLIPRRSH
jgi:O-antigen/teichoic acid export membrane protein